MLRTFVMVIFLSVLQTSVVGAQTKAAEEPAQAAAVVQPEARAVLEAARRAAQATRDLAASIETVIDTDGVSSTLRAEMHVVFADDRFPLKAWRFELPQQAGQSGPRSTVSGIGDRIYQLYPAGKELVEVDLQGLPPMPRDATFLMPVSWFIAERSGGSLFPGMPAPRDLRAEMREPEVIDGVSCAVVRVVRETTLAGASGNMTLTADMIVALGIDDHLPRRITTVLVQSVGGKSATQTTTTHLRSLRQNLSPADEVFRLALPEGFTRRVEKTELDPSLRALGVTIGEPAPPVTLRSREGKDVTFVGGDKRVLVIGFWSLSTTSSRSLLPLLEGLKERFKGRPVEILSVALGADASTDLATITKDLARDVPIYIHGESLARTLLIRATPALLAIGPDGTYLFAKAGIEASDVDELATLIESKVARSSEPSSSIDVPPGSSHRP